jgi:glycosyltransferase involved in cell wall biosynthesis
MPVPKIKILFLDHAPFIGGAQISLFEHVVQLDKSIFDITVGLSPNAISLGLLQKYGEVNIETVIVPLERLKQFSPCIFSNFLKSVFFLNKFLRENKINLLFCNTVRTQILGSIASLFTKAKTIWFLQDYTFPQFLFIILSCIPQKIIYVSNSVKKYYTLSNDIKNEVVHIWRDPEKFIRDIDKDNIAAIRKELGITNEFVVGYVGRLVDWKGPQLLVDAMNELINKNNFRNIKCVIIGTGENQDGNNGEKLKRRVKEFQLNDNVFFLGHRNDVPILMKVMNVFCLTSIRPEPYSSTVIEAMMSKLPVIATDNGGTAEIVKDNRTGLLVKANDFLQLSAAIEELKTNQGLSDKIVSNAFLEVMKNNTAGLVAKKLEIIYQQLI